MATFRIDIEPDEKPTFCVDVEGDDEPSIGEIDDAVTELASLMTFDGYMAEHATKVGWTITNIERYD